MRDGSHSDNRGGVAPTTVPLRPQIGLGLSGSGLLVHRTWPAALGRLEWAMLPLREWTLPARFHELAPTEVAEEHQVLIP